MDNDAFRSKSFFFSLKKKRTCYLIALDPCTCKLVYIDLHLQHASLRGTSSFCLFSHVLRECDSDRVESVHALDGTREANLECGMSSTVSTFTNMKGKDVVTRRGCGDFTRPSSAQR